MPLLVLAVTVGLFEAVFFRGFIQTRLEASFGSIGGVAGASLLYAVYHVGYGMGPTEMLLLFGLGVVYAVAYATVRNVLVLWPLPTPLGSSTTTWSPATSRCRGQRYSASPTSSHSWRRPSGLPSATNGALLHEPRITTTVAP